MTKGLVFETPSWNISFRLTTGKMNRKVCLTYVCVWLVNEAVSLTDAILMMLQQAAVEQVDELTFTFRH